MTNKKFEYFRHGNLSDEALNDLGNDGWELVSVTTREFRLGNYEQTFIFKRQIEEVEVARPPIKTSDVFIRLNQTR